ncbi:ABC-three component system middle component 6 [Mycoplasma capricolum]|uniref:ABC-three component system middle component 6 n=1 Tax=Mycoplasma capricolum TaxID=2095 RepID=UPI003DA5EC71
MLLPKNIHPKTSVYYNAYIVLKELKKYDKIHIMELFININQENVISLALYTLCLDWLFIIGCIKMDNKGCVRLCSLNN